MLEIGMNTARNRKKTWSFPQNSIRSSRRKEQKISDYTERSEGGRQDILIKSQGQALHS